MLRLTPMRHGGIAPLGPQRSHLPVALHRFVFAIFGSNTNHQLMKCERNVCLIAFAVAELVICPGLALTAANPPLPLLNEPVDVSGDFRDFSNTYYLADRLAEFNPTNASGKIRYQRAEYFTRQAFDNMPAPKLAVVVPCTKCVY